MARRTGTEIGGHLLTRHLRAIQGDYRAMSAQRLSDEDWEQTCKSVEVLTRVEGLRTDVLLRSLALLTTGRCRLTPDEISTLARRAEVGELDDVLEAVAEVGDAKK